MNFLFLMVIIQKKQPIQLKSLTSRIWKTPKIEFWLEKDWKIFLLEISRFVKKKKRLSYFECWLSFMLLNKFRRRSWWHKIKSKNKSKKIFEMAFVPSESTNLFLISKLENSNAIICCLKWRMLQLK